MINEEDREIRDHLRAARAMAYADAEDFKEIAFVLERWGGKLNRRIADLGTYEKPLTSVALRSVLATVIPRKLPLWHSDFETLYKVVRDARNDTMHQGASARHLTNNALQLCLILEDALMNGASVVGDFMVREPVCAMSWQPLSFIRQQMLKNAFTYLPFLTQNNGKPSWRLVSDFQLALFLREGDRKARLAMTLQQSIVEGLLLDNVNTCKADATPSEALLQSKGFPLLVVGPEDPARLVGILAPFDLL